MFSIFSFRQEASRYDEQNSTRNLNSILDNSNQFQNLGGGETIKQKVGVLFNNSHGFIYYNF